MASKCVVPVPDPGGSKTEQTTRLDVSKDNALQENLINIGLKQADIEFIIEQGERYIEKPVVVLAGKLKIPKEKAKLVIEALISFKQQQQQQQQQQQEETTGPISQDYIKLIENCLKENPEVNDPEDVADICEVELTVVRAYFDSMPFNETQEEAIKTKLNSGNSISDIAKILKLPEKKVRDYIETTFITFSGADGQKMLGIIQKRFPEIGCSKLREMILSRDLKLQDKLCCILRKQNIQGYKLLKEYFGRFEESKSFFEIKFDLSNEVVSLIRDKYNSGYLVEDIANILKLPDTIVRDYIETTFITFGGADGQKMLGIIQERFPEIECSKLREMILSRDLKLQDKLCCILRKQNIQEYDLLKEYFGRFEESKSFFEIKFELSNEVFSLIRDKLNSGYLVEDIANILKLPDTIVRDYIETTFITFNGADGQKMLGIIQERFPEIECSKLREMILSRDLKLQDKLCCILQKKNIQGYKLLKEYFGRFEESKSFFEIKFDLSNEVVSLIRGKLNSGYLVEDIANILKLPDTIVRDYIETTFITFGGADGQKMLGIIQKRFPEIECSKLREMILSRDLKLQDKLCCILQKQNIQGYKLLKEYFGRFEESKSFFEIKFDLSNEVVSLIRGKLNSGYLVEDIANILKLPDTIVRDYIETTFITFTGADGQKMLGIIQERFPKIECSKLREMILSRDLKLQDKLCYILQKQNFQGYKLLKEYFGRFEESKSFFEIDLKLTIADIFLIKERSLDTIEQLSKQLNKVETVIEEYLEQYHPYSLVRDYCMDLQTKNIQQIVQDFGNDSITFQMYRMIVSNSFESLVHDIQQKEQPPKYVLRQLIPLAFYYLKCSLSLDPVTQIIADSSKITLTTHDLFHILFQLSDPVLRGYCIEHYSFSNPVPLYYPNINGKFKICQELWYSLQEYNGLVSFGLGRASWNPIGKSYLLDFIFSTDFVRGSPQTSAFHLNSIDIQMTKNLFGDNNESSGESTKWAYIDCHRTSDLPIVNIICQQLDIALIHVSYLDYSKSSETLMRDISNLTKSVKHVYLLIRDCEGDEVRVECKETQRSCKKFIFIPNLTKPSIKIHSVKRALKKIGYEILHLKYPDPKHVSDVFLEKIMEQLDKDNFKSEKKLIRTMTEPIKKAAQSSGKISFSFLTYYPLFIEYMNHYYKSFYECDQETVDYHNAQRTSILSKLYKGKMGEVITDFNKLLKGENSSLLLWKLSQNLSLLSQRKTVENKASRISEQNNDLYTVEIIWREAFLSYYYATLIKKEKKFLEIFASNFCNQVERGEPFELIDGDNLNFFSGEIYSLLSGQECSMKQAPIVVSILGPQSSGKSTLLNYCFGCKFLTSAGRCTRGIYGSLSRLSRPVNLSNNFLILDTEGLDAIERGNIKETAHLHFDRTMVLFCLAVSQVVIINVRGDLGNEMQNLLHVCANSLNKLKVRKVPVPKIFFVLNQQADPDTNKHLNSINIMLEKLNEISEFLETDGVKASDLIQLSKENFFILPSAFNSEQMNEASSSLYDSNVIKLSPSTTFADKCAKLRTSIINQLEAVPAEERAYFETLSDWMEMSGTIWDTIIRYQDIVKYENIEEEKCSNMLKSLISDLLANKICCHNQQFIGVNDKIIKEIHAIDTFCHPVTVLTKYMMEFDDVFNEYQDKCLKEFDFKCQTDPLLKMMNHVCVKAKSNLSRLIYMERKVYEDILQFHIRAVLTEIKLSESMKKFQEMLIQRVDTYLDKTIPEQGLAFNDNWNDCFKQDVQEHVEGERNIDFTNLYSIFMMESTNMENTSIVSQIFFDHNFKTEVIIDYIKSEILTRFQLGPKEKTSDDFIFPCSLPIIPINSWTPYPGRDNYEYLDPASLCGAKNPKYCLDSSQFKSWVPKECYPLINYRSGSVAFNLGTAWSKMKKKTQILLLASKLRYPYSGTSIWEKLIEKICKEVQVLIERDPKVSQATVKQIVHLLSDCIKIVNYEISFIEANLTIQAERMISTLAFALAFHSLWNIKKNKSLENPDKTLEKKDSLFKYFLQKIENRKMVQGKWDSEKMKESDITLSNKFAHDFIESLIRGLKTSEQLIIEEEFRKRKNVLSHEKIFFAANTRLTTELYATQDEVLCESNFVIQYICNRNNTLRNTFLEECNLLVKNLYCEIGRNFENKLKGKIETMKQVFAALLYELGGGNLGAIEKRAFDSDHNFEIVDLEEHGPEAKECPFKAVVLYLKMYLDPMITSEQFSKFFNNPFEIDGVNVKKSGTFILCDKQKNPDNYLDEDLFKKLDQTNMFNTEYIFNILEYISEFHSELSKYHFQLTENDFEDMIQHIKEESETDALGCPNQCPSCGKLCERELHPNDGKCQLKTGHQICSMGGKVWKNGDCKTAVLFMCDDYNDDTKVHVSGKAMSWKKFKNKCENQWNWNIPKDPTYAKLQEENREKMEKIWDQFGRGILNYYSARGTMITYTPYTSLEELTVSLIPLKYFICFVIDGTSSMATEINKARISVGQFISNYSEYESRFSVVIYRDHCDKKLTEIFPADRKFTLLYKSVQEFLKTVKAYGGGDYPEAVLDGLATATTQCNWIDSSSVKNVIIHIFDAPPHGDFPNYKSHDSQSNKKHCCCCNHGTKCLFDWKRDVWDNMKRLNIHYYGINTGVNFPKFEATMRDNLGDLCDKFQIVGKEVVDEAILQIFIDH